jgi:hypothetical protein
VDGLKAVTMDVRDLIGVRERIQADHAELRGLLESVTVTARGLLHDVGSGREGAAVAALRFAVAGLVTRFERHLEMEEIYLLPILRRLDGWGDVRAEEISSSTSSSASSSRRCWRTLPSPGSVSP